ncbi:hypothetical protein GCM10010399_61570 [Dactylosporangium fulvum]|uniref:Uncharacterized protein n=1 Tax=Dactylosporangium fulvum TaxID=53359 RepID=A0ABY5VN88_9ACTN|nr:hypothetical protein [Dactylosporangium fulvum]UWP78720.1 hypothetical protein Dfulv_26485 [Dactylosporangium fulvum]
MLVEVRGKVPGRSRDDIPVALLELAEERIAVAALIERAVEEQIRLMEADRVRCRAMLDRQYLSADEIRAQAAGGVIRLPAGEPAAPDVASEVAKARRAFERGVFAVFAGGRQVERLDEVVTLRIGEPVLFLRLTPLVGG